MESLEQWMLHTLSTEDILEIAEHGVNGLHPLLGTGNDTCKMYERFHEEIWDIVLNEWKSLSIFVGSKDITSAWLFERYITWEAVKITAKQIASEDI